MQLFIFIFYVRFFHKLISKEFLVQTESLLISKVKITAPDAVRTLNASISSNSLVLCFFSDERFKLCGFRIQLKAASKPRAAMMCHETSTIVVIGIKHRNRATQVLEIFKKYLAYQCIKQIPVWVSKCWSWICQFSSFLQATDSRICFLCRWARFRWLRFLLDESMAQDLQLTFGACGIQGAKHFAKDLPILGEGRILKSPKMTFSCGGSIALKWWKKQAWKYFLSLYLTHLNPSGTGEKFWWTVPQLILGSLHPCIHHHSIHHLCSS